MTTIPALTGTPLSGVLARLSHPKRQGTGYVARCPAHDDRNPSLVVSEAADGRVLLHCHTGCTPEAVVGALGLDMRDLWPAADEPITPPTRAVRATYEYTDADGTPLYEVVRYEPKDFRQRRPDPDRPDHWLWSVPADMRVLYRLPDVIEALALGHRVWIVEGEKDCDAMRREGCLGVATTSGGATSWRPEYAALFRGASDVVVLPDNDEPGQQFAQTVAQSLTDVGAAVRVVQLPGVPAKGDVSDWLSAGGDWDALEDVVQATRLWTPDPRTATAGGWMRCWATLAS